MVNRRNLARQSAYAEAAAWIARLQSTDQGAATETELRSWLEADPENRAAFDRATEIWGLIPDAARLHRDSRPENIPPVPTRQASRRMPPRAWAFGLAASLLLFFATGTGWWLMSLPVQYSTGRGEQEMATLEDGTRISLNTDTALSVRYEKDRREVRLDHGEAMFEVASNPERPFVVAAGSKTVTALGTIFIVRRTGSDLAVTLIEGRVAVDNAHEASPIKPTPVILAPGERLQVVTDKPASIDRPSLEAATAWRQGRAVFDDVPLSIAVAELNRYGGARISIEDPQIASMRVSGVFATNDTAEFARAIAALHGLRVERNEGELRIVR